MTGEKETGSNDMKAQTASTDKAIIERLCESARIEGLPDKAFFKSFTPRRRREIVYKVQAEAGDFVIRLEVHGSGVMKARLRMPCVSIEDAVIDENDHEHDLSWAHNGEQALIRTRLDHKHLEAYPCPRDIMSAFIDAIDTQTRAVCPGGYAQWRAIMQLFADRIAREAGVPIEMVALLPLPTEHTGSTVKGPTDVEISDITDPDAPRRIEGYENELREMDETMTPEAMTLMLLPPGYLVCRRHREIFTAG